MNDDYLWDGSGPIDPEIARLERALLPLRMRRAALPRRRGAPWLAAAALAALAVSLHLAKLDPRDRAAARNLPYRIASVAGSPRVVARDGSPRAADGLRIGDAIVTGTADRARIRVARIGTVLMEPDSRLRIAADRSHSDDDGYSLFLEQGAVVAAIFATPRLFQVGTPAGIAVDLGCVYRAEVRTDGSTCLQVQTGAVSFETDDRRAYVPSRAECIATAEGPGPAYWRDKPPEFQAAVHRLDLDYLIAHAEVRDTLTLWHFLQADGAEVRRRALRAIEALVGLPAGIDTAGILAADRDALDALRQGFEWSWW